jgi:hypothetical protein
MGFKRQEECCVKKQKVHSDVNHCCGPEISKKGIKNLNEIIMKAELSS